MSEEKIEAKPKEMIIKGLIREYNPSDEKTKLTWVLEHYSKDSKEITDILLKNDFKQLIRPEVETQKQDVVAKFVEFLKGIYKELNGKEPSVTVTKYLPFTQWDLLLISFLSGIPAIYHNFIGSLVVFSVTLSSILRSKWNATAWRDIATHSFGVNSRKLKEACRLGGPSPYSESIAYRTAVHEVAHSTKRVYFKEEDSKEAKGIMKQVILDTKEHFPYTTETFLFKEEEFDAYVRGELARIVYLVFKRPESRFFNYFGDKTDEALYKIGAYIAKADPKDLINNFKDFDEIVKNCSTIVQSKQA